MKKIIIIVLVSIIILFLGFNIYKAVKDLDKKIIPKNMKINDKIDYNEDGIILEYYIKPNEGTIQDFEDYRYITLYADKRLVWGKKISGEQGSKTLSKKEFNSIISIAFTKKFKSIRQDISDNTVLDGSSSYIILYYNDGTSFKVGGLNPNEEQFNKLVQKLNSLTK